MFFGGGEFLSLSGEGETDTLLPKGGDGPPPPPMCVYALYLKSCHDMKISITYITYFG